MTISIRRLVFGSLLVLLLLVAFIVSNNPVATAGTVVWDTVATPVEKYQAWNDDLHERGRAYTESIRELREMQAGQ